MKGNRTTGPITYRRYGGTPYIATYPIGTLAFRSSDMRLSRRGYVNYGEYTVTYPFNIIRVISAVTRGYSLYGRHDSNARTYVRIYPARTLQLVSSGKLRRVGITHRHGATTKGTSSSTRPSHDTTLLPIGSHGNTSGVSTDRQGARFNRVCYKLSPRRTACRDSHYICYTRGTGYG